MASKVLIKLPVSFGNQLISGNKPTNIIRAEPVSHGLSSMTSVTSSPSDPLLRITQLEQNIKFLQEQHLSMLSSLHEEIECLRRKNRDLQFQLIFGRNGISVTTSSSESSPEDSCNPKVILSPKQVNTRSIQVEILEKEITELKNALVEANNKNGMLTQQLELQKKQQESVKKENIESDYVKKLEEADELIKKLIKENEEQKKELQLTKNQANSKSAGNSRYGSGSRRNGDHNSANQRFPPLQGHGYWAQSRNRQNFDYGGTSHSSNQSLDHENISPLPHLTRTFSQSSSAHNKQRYYNSNSNNYNHDDRDGRRKHRGGNNYKNHKDTQQSES